MSLFGPVRVKICCIRSVEEILLAVRHGVSALGFVSRMPSGPGVITEDLIADLVPRVPPGIGTFLLTCESSADAIVDQQKRTGVNTIQICDAVPPGAHKELRHRLPGVTIVQVIHVTGDASVKEALEAARDVHGLLLDSGNPSLEVKELGGTGRVHDWTHSRRIVELSPVPVFLAGGLNPGNVAEAIRRVGPYGVDVCTGVRTDGALDAAKLAAFSAVAATAGR